MNTQNNAMLTYSNGLLADWQESSAKANWRGVVFCEGDWCREEASLNAVSDRCFSSLAEQLNLLSTIQTAFIYCGSSELSGYYSQLTDSLSFTATFLSTNDTKSMLGQECDLLVLLIDRHFSFESIGQLTGMLKAGGLCIFLVPEGFSHRITDQEVTTPSLCWWYDSIASWCELESSEWLAINIKTHTCKSQRSSRRPLVSISQPVIPKNTLPTDDTLLLACISYEQYQAVLAVMKVALGHRRRPCVIEADRGRGKSASLGIAAAELIAKHGKKTIWVCAHNKRAIAQVFRYCHKHLESTDLSSLATVTLLPHANLPNQLQVLDSEKRSVAVVKFLAPDTILSALEVEVPELLIIDEAASLPLPLLLRIVRIANRVAFASTVHGYEGTGRSFELRFKPQIQASSLGLTSVAIHTPARWAINDALESLTAHTLLLSTSSFELPKAILAPNALHCVCLRNEELITQKELLEQSFSLLVLAHYKTSPADLQQLLDQPSTLLFVLYQQTGHVKHVVGCCLIMLEGELPLELADAIQCGKRRLKGHLLPQALATHCQQPKTISWQFARVVRIAVRPELQQQGIGSQLLTRVCQSDVLSTVDFIGSSFGATDSLISFWGKHQFQVCRLGVKQDSVSGEYAALVLYPCSMRASALLPTLVQRFQHYLRLQLPSRYRSLSPALVAALITADQEVISNVVELQRVAPLIMGGVDIDGLFVELHHLACSFPSMIEQPLNTLFEVLIVKVLQARDWSEYAAHFQLSGQKAAQEHFRQAFEQVRLHSD